MNRSNFRIVISGSQPSAPGLGRAFHEQITPLFLNPLPFEMAAKLSNVVVSDWFLHFVPNISRIRKKILFSVLVINSTHRGENAPEDSLAHVMVYTTCLCSPLPCCQVAAK
jgi:hypothetical protein